jgi:hypothetical protein
MNFMHQQLLSRGREFNRERDTSFICFCVCFCVVGVTVVCHDTQKRGAFDVGASLEDPNSATAAIHDPGPPLHRRRALSGRRGRTCTRM